MILTPTRLHIFYQNHGIPSQTPVSSTMYDIARKPCPGDALEADRKLILEVATSVDLHGSIDLPHKPEASVEANGASQDEEGIRNDQHVTKVENA